MNDKDHKDMVRKLKKSFANGEFESFITHVRFPYFKNLERNARIDFQFPITVLVGQNGTNKSSVIKALFGCPNGKNITRYWFTTETDVFPELQLTDGSSLKPRYIYGYKNEFDKEVEILQTRVNATKQTLDYWETSRPLVGDDMESQAEVALKTGNATRFNKIRKPLVFLDFRSELSAYDRCMYHSDYKVRKKKSGKLITKQEFIRGKSKYIKKAFDENLKSLKLWNKETIVRNITLNPKMIEAVSYVLGRDYQNIRFLEHRFWGARGGTALLSTDQLSYTEAYAGSGEFAVVSLIISLFNAKPNSLVLLDEPEVSLHPGAQKRAMEIIFEIVSEKKHQVVISTHSPTIVNFLPKESIKLFIYDLKTETSKIAQNISADEAFVELGHDLSCRTIITEDKIAAELVKRAIRNDERLRKSFNIIYIPGGAETILSKHLPTYSLVDRKDILFLLDGDKNKKLKPKKIEEISDRDLVTTMKQYFDCELTVNASGNRDGVNKDELKKSQRAVLEYAFKKVHYLPVNTPEEFLISECENQQYLSIINENEWDLEDKDVNKNKIEFLSQKIIGKEKDEISGADVFAVQNILLTTIDYEHVVFKQIRKSLAQALDRGIIE
ncbi:MULTISPECIES: ATP-dependent nuclease [unclassified Pantoea]|uniref:ATP-dependent nuclease n=1 Tax=unclassified Pantoea TaxID=2630326 RepID=UPI001CD29386|nr:MULTISPECIES: ATP-binding protein [unclassified Pantoea]MCA1176659.1 ATP-binding protein [Pantoea sp. alder69]MCA1251572.1 ATP-binding protein [Pantoea sp. alder70]MCA1264297.1 ATP-binding protein [Pantoea sp. alder81]